MQKEKVCDTSKLLPEVRASEKKHKSTLIDKRIESEVDKLRKFTKGVIPKEKRNVVMNMLHELAFMRVKLVDARKILINEQIFTHYNNGGGQMGIREHPGFTAYNKLFATYQRGIKQLCDLMPSGSAAADDLTDYLEETRL